MGYPLTIARRYLTSKKRNMISISTVLAIMGVMLGVAALAIVMSVTGGFQEQFREKVLGVNAHVLVLKYSIDFREYRRLMAQIEEVPELKGAIEGMEPFVINPMMLTHAQRTATGVLLKGVDPGLMGTVLDLPKHIVEGNKDLEGMRRPGAKPPVRSIDPSFRVDEQGAPLRNGAPPAYEPPVREELADAGAPAPDRPRTGDAGASLAQAPQGDVVPDGGYKSELPDIDVIPDALDPDPCKSEGQIATLPGVVIGKTLAKQLEVSVGDCVQVTSPTIGPLYSSHPAIAKQFRIIAIFEAGFDQYDSKLVYADLYEAQAFYEYGDSVTGIEMRVKDIDGAADVAHQIELLLGDPVYHTMDWMELNHGLFTALLIQQIMMSFILALIILVAAFTVIATLIMVVLDKKKEIALLKAIGATDSAILRVFLYQGAIIGTAGTSLGLLVGYLCCRFLNAYGFPLDAKVYFISKLPVSMHPSEFIVTGVISIVICIVGTIFPARYASRLRPSDGLRAE